MRMSWKKWTIRVIRNPYLTINLAFGLVCIAIVGYALIYPPATGSHPIPCVFTTLTGEECAGCGLSRGFSHVVRFNFETAQEINPHSVGIFLFFALQLTLRIAGSILYLNTRIPHPALFTGDALLSLTAFIATFMPMASEFINNVMQNR